MLRKTQWTPEERSQLRPTDSRCYEADLGRFKNVVIKPLGCKDSNPEKMAFLKTLSEEQFELYKIPAGYVEVVKAAMRKEEKPKIDWLALNRDMSNY